jgi:hypothetical protein
MGSIIRMGGNRAPSRQRRWSVARLVQGLRAA